MKPQANVGRKFDANSFKSTFINANDSLMKLMKLSPIPSTEIVVGADSLKDHAMPFLPRGSAPALQTGSKLSVRTNTVDDKLTEMHKKLDNLKGKKKTDYKDRVLKNGLKKKITKKEKKEMYKKLNLIRSQEPGAAFVPKAEEEDKKDLQLPTAKPVQPVYNSEGKMVFSKFEFDESTKLSIDMRGKKFYDPKALLHKLAKENESMKNLELSGDMEKIKAAKEEHVWKKALQMADGVKLKDDPARLEKAAKKIKKRKQKHQAEWEARKEAVDKKMSFKSKKRQTNINDRQNKVKNNKLRKSAKKGRVIPGF